LGTDAGLEDQNQIEKEGFLNKIIQACHR